MSHATDAVKMFNAVQKLRRLIRAEGTPAIRAAWQAVDPHIDYGYSRKEG